MVVKELLIKWGFDIDDKAISKLDAGVNNLKKSIFVIGTAGIAAAAGLFGLAKSVANAGDKARKTAQGIGLTTEAYQELGFVAEIGGMTQESMGVSMAKLARTAKEASDGVATYKDTYDELNISVKDSRGELKSTDVLMAEVADRFAVMEDGTKKTALAMDLFGRSGAQLIPTLNQGSAAISKLRKEARDSGRVMSDEAAKKAEDFNDAITRLQSVITGIKNTIGVALIPAITEIIDSTREWLLANREMIKQKLQAAIKIVIGFLKSLMFIVRKTYDIVSSLAQAFGGLGKVLKIVAAGFAIFYAARLIMGLGQVASGVFGIIKAMKTLRVGILLTQASALLVPLLVGAAVIALGLIIEDIIAFFRGADSVIMPMLREKWPGGFEFLMNVIGLVKDKILGTIEAFKLVYNYVKTHSIGEILKEGLVTFFDFFKFMIGEVLGGLKSVAGIFGLFKKEEIAMPKVETPEGAAAAPIEAGPPPMTTAERIATMTPQAAPIPAAMGGPGGQRVTNIDVRPNIKVEVPPETPPEMVGAKVSEGVENAIGKMLRDTARATEPAEAF